MKLLEFVRERQWIPITGYLIYVSALTAGTITTSRSSNWD